MHKLGFVLHGMQKRLRTRLRRTDRSSLSLNLSAGHLVLLSVVTILASLYWQSVYFDRRDHPDKFPGRERAYANRDKAFALITKKLPIEAANEKGKEIDRESLSREALNDSHADPAFGKLFPVFQTRLDQYKKTLSSLNSNLFYQFLGIAAALIILLSGRDRFPVPLLQHEVPSSWLHRALPAYLLAIWTQFGFLLNEVINSRLALWRLGEALEPFIELQKQNLLVVNSGANEVWRQYLYAFSMRPIVNDGGFMDGWFIEFHGQFVENQQLGVLFAQFILVFFAVFWGIGHGCMLGTIWQSARRFPSPGFPQGFYIVYFWIVVFFLGLSHYTFFVTAAHQNWTHPIVFASTLLTTLLLVHLSPNPSHAEATGQIQDSTTSRNPETVPPF
jgi:hypothetical protein